MSQSIDPKIADSCWKDFDEARYVERSLDGEVASWLDSRVNDRPLLSLVGPPGVGKSWLLGKLRQAQEKQGRFVALLKASDLLDPTSHEAIKLDLVDRANASCRSLSYPTVLLPSLPALIEDLTQRFCSRCPDQRFLVLVDDCDDLASQTEFDLVQREYLRRFFAGPCVRMVVARRLDLTDYNLRRRNTTLRVGVFEQREAESQRESLNQENWPSLPVECAYRWNHPYINCYLLAVHDNGQPITTETLTACCRSLIERAGLRSPSWRYDGGDHLTELKHIAKTFFAPWTSAEYRAIIGKDFDITYVRHGLVSVIQSQGVLGPTCEIVDGLRELLQALPD